MAANESFNSDIVSSFAARAGEGEQVPRLAVQALGGCSGSGRFGRLLAMIQCGRCLAGRPSLHPATPPNISLIDSRDVLGVHSLVSCRRRRTHTSHHICHPTNYIPACTITASGRVDTCTYPARVSKRCGQENVLVTVFCSTQFISLHLQHIIYAFLRIAAHISNISADSEDVPTRVHYLFRASAHAVSYPKHVLPGIYQCANESAPDK